MHSSGHAQGSKETQEERVALLFDVLTQIHNNKHGQTETQRDTLSTCVAAGFPLSPQMLEQMFDQSSAVFSGNIKTFPQNLSEMGLRNHFLGK